MMILTIDLAGEVPIYQQIRDQIILGIAKKELTLNESLPSVRQLADDLGVNMMTVSKAYTLLKNQGYVETDRRQGTKIVKEVIHSPEHQLFLQDQLKLVLAEAKIAELNQDQVKQLVTEIYSTFEKEA